MNGLLVLDKPAGVTSRDVVNVVQRWLPRRTKVGHAGTLDPLATGVLVVCVGSVTRLVESIHEMPKTYRTRVRLGATSDTDDADGTLTPNPAAGPAAEADVRAALAGFVGDVRQTPPAYSAAHVGGKRAYDLARRGRELDLASRTVRIDAIDVLGYDWPTLELEIRCGTGTYIRSIARDLGERLGVGGHVEALRRTRVGPFVPDMAPSLDHKPADVRNVLRPAREAVASLPPVTLTEAEIDRLRHGQPIASGSAAEGSESAGLDAAGKLVAVIRADGKGKAWPSKVMMG